MQGLTDKPVSSKLKGCFSEEQKQIWLIHSTSLAHKIQHRTSSNL